MTEQSSTRQPTCEERIDDQLNSTVETLRHLWDAYTQAECPECDGEGEYTRGGDIYQECPECAGTGKLGDEDGNTHDGEGNIYEYGLSFDFVIDPDQEPYFRYQLSWGGPSDEFRFYAPRISEYQFHLYRVEYWFLDWFDGAHRIINGDDLDLLTEIFDWFVEGGSANAEFQKAVSE